MAQSTPMSTSTPAVAEPQANEAISSTQAAHPALSYQSIMPTLDGLLDTIRLQATSEKPSNAVEASEAVTKQARELAANLEEMRQTAFNLPGGQYSLEEIKELTSFLDAEAESRRDVLRRFERQSLYTVDELAPQTRSTAGDVSAIQTPLPPQNSED